MAGAEQESSHTAKCAAAENPDALRSVSKSNWALALLFARLKTERTSSYADVFKREMLLKSCWCSGAHWVTRVLGVLADSWLALSRANCSVILLRTHTMLSTWLHSLGDQSVRLMSFSGFEVHDLRLQH